MGKQRHYLDYLKTNHVLQHQHAEHGLHEDRGSLEEENGKKRLGNDQKIRVILTKLPAKIKTSNISIKLTRF